MTLTIGGNMVNAPSCFGKLWDSQDPKCRGGNDPTYIHPQTGKCLREPCRWQAQCAAETNGQKTQNAHTTPRQPLIPTHNLMKPPPAPPRLLPPPPMHGHQTAPRQQPTTQHPYQQQPLQAPQQLVHYSGQTPYAAPHMAAVPTMVPMNQPMMGAATQSFLVAPEPASGSHGQRIARTVFRSMVKGAALAMANYMDYYPLGAMPPAHTPGE